MKDETKKKLTTFIWIIVIVMFLFLFFHLFAPLNLLTISGEAVRDFESNQIKCTNKQVPYTVQEPYTKTEYYTDTVPYTDKECENKKLVYKSSNDNVIRDVTCIEDYQECKQSHTNFWGDTICDSMVTICNTYKETVSFEITNLDNEKGLWIVNWEKVCRSGENNLCNYEKAKVVQSMSKMIDPTETRSLEFSITYDAKAQEFLYPVIQQEPTKQICKDVTKYKDVQKERQVTDYKQVTNYKIERVCE